MSLRNSLKSLVSSIGARLPPIARGFGRLAPVTRFAGSLRELGRPAPVTRFAGSLRELGVYAVIVLIIPGGSLIALGAWALRHREAAQSKALRP